MDYNPRKFKSKYGKDYELAPPKLIVLSGAGLSAESGLPTFRDMSDGIWETHDLKKVCNYLTWKTYRPQVFEFYHSRKQQYHGAVPNVAHELLAKWQSAWGADRVVLLTQNVDGLLQSAGAESVVELHGNLHSLHCTACGNIWNHEIDVNARCPKCDSLKGVKPNVIFFNQSAPEYTKLKSAVSSFRRKDILVYVGTSFEVLPLDLLPVGFYEFPNIFNVNPVKENHEIIKHHVEQPATSGLLEIESLLISLMSKS